MGDRADDREASSRRTAYGCRMHSQRKLVAVVSAAVIALGLALTGCANEANEPPSDSAPPATTAPDESEAVDEARTPRGADLAITEFTISWEDAVDAALVNFDGELAEFELDWHRDRYAYDVELVSDVEEYEVRVDADTGEQYDERTEKIETDDLAEKQAEVVNLDAVVSWDDAVAAALDAQSGTVNEWKLEGTKHGPQYEFDVDDDSGEDYEVSVNAETGEVIKVDD